MCCCPFFFEPLDTTVAPGSAGKDEKTLNNMTVKRNEDGWTVIRACADTGAEMSACARSVCPDRDVFPTASSKAGRNFTGADGNPIENEGEQYYPSYSPEGVYTLQRWSTAKTSRPLLSISEECDKGQLAIFGSGGGALINLQTRQVRHLPRVGGTYEAEMWIPSREMEAAALSGFTRQDW